jgi:FkbM family methyltransferase
MPLLRKAMRRRISCVGVTSILRQRVPSSTRVFYFDLGLHRDARQVHRMLEWFGHVDLRVFGFEAHPDYCSASAAQFTGRENVQIINAAVVGPDHPDSVPLYFDGQVGKGDSLFSARGATKVDVRAIRLSQFIRDHGIDPAKEIIILRMNIEGSEIFVLEDLIDAGIAKMVDGFYGLWNDPERLVRDSDFPAMVRNAGIENFTFNNRDAKHPKREELIRYDITTSILAGARRKGAL